MQHILAKGESHDDFPSGAQTLKPLWIFFPASLCRISPFYHSFRVLLLHDKVDLCKDQLSLHGINVSLHAGISKDYRQITSYFFKPLAPDLPLSFQFCSFREGAESSLTQSLVKDFIPAKCVHAHIFPQLLQTLKDHHFFAKKKKKPKNKIKATQHTISVGIFSRDCYAATHADYVHMSYTTHN